MNKAQLKRRAAKRQAGKCVTPYCRGKTHNHPRCSKCMMRAWRSKFPLKASYAALKYRAKRRGIAFSLTLAEFRQICDRSGYLESKGVTRAALQIDRIDPHVGYTWDNCQIITCSENAAKGNYERANHSDNEPF